jgi:hypothetical protein
MNIMRFPSHCRNESFLCRIMFDGKLLLLPL